MPTVTDETTTVRTSDGVALVVEDVGQGDPIVLLHGFPDDRTMWDRVVPLLVAGGHRVIRYDQRSAGASDAPAGVGRYAADRIVADVLEVLDARGVTEPVTLVGHDWGAMISWMAAIAHPARFRRHVALSVGHPSSYRSAGLEQQRKGLYVLLFQVRGLPERLLLASDLRLARRFLRTHPRFEHVRAHVTRPGRLTAGIDWYRANLGALLTRRWGRCRVPTLGVFSTGDDYLTERQLVGSARYVDGEFAYVRLPGPGHWFPVEEPERTAELVLGWAAR